MSSEIRVVSTLGGHDPTRPRKSCHRCGNVRKVMAKCSGGCVFLYCASCKKKLIEEFGEAAFHDGCPRCKGLCCCFNKSMDCPYKNHCYKKCPTTFGKREMPKNKSVPKPPSLPPPFSTNTGSPTYQLATIASRRATESSTLNSLNLASGNISTPTTSMTQTPNDPTSALIESEIFLIGTGADQLMQFALSRGTSSLATTQSNSTGSGSELGRSGPSSTTLKEMDSFTSPVTDTCSGSTYRFGISDNREVDSLRGSAAETAVLIFPKLSLSSPQLTQYPRALALPQQSVLRVQARRRSLF